MSAYIVVEGTPRDNEALDRYASKAIPMIKAFGGEVIVFGPWELLVGEAVTSSKHIDEGAEGSRHVAAVGVIEAEPW